jgi:hypothetical protein
MLAFCETLRGSAETSGRLKDARSVDCFMVGLAQAESSVEPELEITWFPPLNLTCDILVSKFA